MSSWLVSPRSRSSLRSDCRKAALLQHPEQVILALPLAAGQLFERVDEACVADEDYRVAREPLRGLHPPVAVLPLLQRLVPRQVQEVRLTLADLKREEPSGCRHGGAECHRIGGGWHGRMCRGGRFRAEAAGRGRHE